MAVLNPYNYSRPKGAVATRPVSAVPNPKISASRNQTPQKNNTDQYLEQKILSATPEELTLMLYEGAIKFIKQAMLFNEEKAIEKTSKAILRVQAIYTELQGTLNMDYEISNELDRLYEYALHRLVEANVSKDNEILQEVLTMTEDFRDTWKEAMEIAGKK